MNQSSDIDINDLSAWTLLLINNFSGVEIHTVYVMKVAYFSKYYTILNNFTNMAILQIKN